MIAANIDSTFVIETERINLKVEEVSLSHKTRVTPSPAVAAEIPAQVIECSGSAKIATVAY